MTPPAISLERFAWACLLGAGLGGLYGFLRPLRRRHPWLSDGLLLLGVGWVWLYLALAVCGGDLRLGYSAGLLVGAFAWEMTVGRLLQGIFRLFWQAVGRILGLAGWPVKKL